MHYVSFVENMWAESLHAGIDGIALNYLLAPNMFILVKQKEKVLRSIVTYVVMSCGEW